MFKRLRWMLSGAAIGAGGTIWAQRKMRAVASRYRPAGVAQGAASRAIDAWREGRIAMREREAELRGGRSHRRPGPAVGADGRRSHRP
jgi:hypothetical protein